ncbi:MAG: adenine deaminase [Prevotellaceae bacterium]|jgi:adenine deaminase|nr:adenine deaminase [Prevotellaceae bacterium]
MTFQLKEEIMTAILSPYNITGFIVDVFNQRIYKGRIYVNVFGQIERIEETDVCEERYIMPGFIDSHVHIESSMLMPSEFARSAVSHGTLATLSDPHEIANVLGIEGVEYFIENGHESGFKFFFGAPSCVPTAPFETSGAHLGLDEVDSLLQKEDIWFLSEMMNFPGVIAGDPEVRAKIDAAKRMNKPVDGHAPCLSGASLEKYIAAGISTDHECMDICEAEEKLSLGMKILIREGSSAKNFDALYPLINQYPSSVMLCTDDSHPDDLKKGYIDKLVDRALSKGVNFFNLLKAVSVNPVLHYGIPVGLLRTGDYADFIVTDSIEQGFKVLQTYISGKLVYDRLGEEINLHRPKIEIKNSFHAAFIDVEDIRVESRNRDIRLIKVIDRELFTESIVVKPAVSGSEIVSSTAEDMLKIVVLNRYVPGSRPAVGFIRGFGLKQGALAGTVAHDSHNLIAVGVDDRSIVECINSLIDVNGGIAVCCDGAVDILPLPVAGIISDKGIDEVAANYDRINSKAKQIGSPLASPFMTLSFMALIVIPQLKICDKGLFDVNKFNDTGLFVEEE